MNFARARGLGVVAGEEMRTSLCVAPDFRGVKFQVFRADGRAVTGQAVGFEVGLAGVIPRNGMLHLDEKGIGEFPFDAPGLWTGVVRFRDKPVNSYPIRQEPYEEAEIVLPVSPAQPLVEPIRLVGIRRGRGSLANPTPGCRGPTGSRRGRTPHSTNRGAGRLDR